MTTKRESILVALLAVIVGVEPTAVRNEPLPDLANGGKVVKLSDGGCDTTEEFLNPPMYEFTMTPTLMIVQSGGTAAERDAAVDATIAGLVTALNAVTDLGDLITAIRPQPPNYSPRELWGAANLKGAEFGIEIDFWSASSAG